MIGLYSSFFVSFFRFNYLVYNMPFSSNKELPSRIKKLFKSEQLRTIFRKTFNNVFGKTRDEEQAFAIATSAAKNKMNNNNEMSLATSILGLHAYRAKVLNNSPDCSCHKLSNKTVVQQLSMTATVEQKLSILDEDTDFFIEGIALQEGSYTGQTQDEPIFYSGDVLNKVAPSLVDKPLRLDHLQGLSDIVGKVVSASYDAVKKAIIFKAKVFDEKAKRLLKEKLVGAVSVGIRVDTVINNSSIEANDGVFEELSLTENPACKTCVITTITGS